MDADQLEEARAELATFGSAMGKKLSEASTQLPSPESSDRSEKGWMDLIREKRLELDNKGPPAKWAKGENKGGLETRAEEAGQSHCAVRLLSLVQTDVVVTPTLDQEDGGDSRPAQGGQRRPAPGLEQQPLLEEPDQNRDRSFRTENQDRQRLIAELVKAIARLSGRLPVHPMLGLRVRDVPPDSTQPEPPQCDGSALSNRSGVACSEDEFPSGDHAAHAERPAFLPVYCPLQRVQELETNVEQMSKIVEAGLVGTAYPYLQWDSNLRKHVQAARDPIGHKEVVDYLNAVLRLIACPHVVGRFHALHKMTGDQTTDIVPFSLIIQGRSPEPLQMYTYLQKLARCSIWHFIAASMRPGKLGRSPLAALAKAIERLMKEL